MKRLFLLTICCIAGFHSFAQSAIDSLLGLPSSASFNGIVAVAENGKMQYLKSRGFADPASHTPLRTDQQFLIGSVSKQITAVLVLLAAEKGQVDLHAPIRRYLPDYADKWADSVTLHQILNHTSGIVMWGQPLAFRPGSRFQYSTVSFSVAADVLEKTSGKTYAALAEALFKRCGMRHSMVPGPGMKKLATPYEKGRAVTFDYRRLPVPGGALVSTVEDLTRWNQLLHTGKILQDSSYRLMITPSSVRPTHRWGHVEYGYGIQIMDGELSHNGYIAGYHATCIWYPAQQISLVVLENITADPADMDGTYSMQDKIRAIVHP
ncbi:serine hydrolase domain-containing protein [Chitinophaga sp. GCM10012297]|uniref:Beta-lactamase family protein n=1 Tax=Chitinophaga chungangae TaxID=2821488 RepID=A0ABS3YHJ5_9BACT|nr:serine hydrolase domain-containing protein [Chitinophaga chungangae]MBO9153549.1 beta-lactamase family protein [Chitinophaga chungangae]